MAGNGRIVSGRIVPRLRQHRLGAAAVRARVQGADEGAHGVVEALRRPRARRAQRGPAARPASQPVPQPGALTPLPTLSPLKPHRHVAHRGGGSLARRPELAEARHLQVTAQRAERRKRLLDLQLLLHAAAGKWAFPDGAGRPEGRTAGRRRARARGQGLCRCCKKRRTGTRFMHSAKSGSGSAMSAFTSRCFRCAAVCRSG